MSDALLFRGVVAGLSLEISTEDGDARATVTYPYPDPRFEQGGFPVVFRVLRRICARLLPPGHMVFLAELSPCSSAEVPPPEPLDLAELEAWCGEQREGKLGALQPFRGYWLSPRTLDELEHHIAPLEHASAEESRIRLLILEREGPGARGWDLLHEDGITTLGRWRVDLDELPAPLDPEDIDPTRALLESLLLELAPLLANGKGHLPS